MSTPASAVRSSRTGSGTSSPHVTKGNTARFPGIYPNLNAGDPTKCLYAPDTSRQAQGAESWPIGTAAADAPGVAAPQIQLLLGRAAAVQRRGLFQHIDGCRKQPESGAIIGAIGLGGLTATTSPETAGYLRTIGSPRATGHLDLADDEPAAARSGTGDHAGAVGTAWTRRAIPHEDWFGCRSSAPAAARQTATSPI